MFVHKKIPEDTCKPHSSKTEQINFNEQIKDKRLKYFAFITFFNKYAEVHP